MVPPAGRPSKGNEETGTSKHRSFRLTDEIMSLIDDCKETLSLRDRTETVEFAIKTLHRSVCGKEKDQ